MKFMTIKMSQTLKPKQVKSVLVLLITIMVMGLTGCFGMTATMAPVELDKTAKEFAPPAHKSYIYVMRNYSFNGDAILMQVLLQERIKNIAFGRKISFLSSDTYVLFEVSPGEYEVITSVFPPSPARMQNTGTLQLETLPGRTYFIASSFERVPVDQPLYIELLPDKVGTKTILDNDYKLAVSEVLGQ